MDGRIIVESVEMGEDALLEFLNAKYKDGSEESIIIGEETKLLLTRTSFAS